MRMNGVVYDIEVLKGCFTYTDINIQTEEVTQFVIHPERDERIRLFHYLREIEGNMIGFNNVNFDYPVLHKFLDKFYWETRETSQLLFDLHELAETIINVQNAVDFNKSVAIRTKDVIIPQIDLFKIWHYNNKARQTSLKSLEISMNFPNVMEMPISHKKEIITEEEIEQILKYNLNDVLATYEFYKKSLDKIKLRNNIKEQYGLPCINFSDSKIGEQLTLKLYCNETAKDFWEVKEQRTNRAFINLGDIIFDYIQFDSAEFNKLLDKYKQKVIVETKGAVEESVIHKGFKYDFGSGGIHGAIKSGVYKSDSEYIIKSCDVASLYPSLAVVNRLYPEHLGESFCTVYKRILDLRVKAKNEGNSVMSDGFKLALNSVYGKSNDVNSFLYDPKYTMSITINGQLLLTMLAESLCKIPDSTMIMINTDGIEIKIPRIYEKLYYEICENWQKKTNLILEYQDYEKMVIADVNTYSALGFNGKYKYKGRFEIDKVVGSEPAYHKDNSFRIIPIALSNYFFNKIPVEESIKNHKNIYDFCGRQKFRGEDYGMTFTLLYDEKGLPYKKQERQQRNVRYYISNKGSSLMKFYNKGTSEFIHKGYQITVFNNFFEKESYDINYDWYIKECYKEIREIENNQLSLF
jgi:hypothetical protein